MSQIGRPLPVCHRLRQRLLAWRLRSFRIIYVNDGSWHKVSSSQSTTKQAFSIGGIYHVTVRFSLEPDRPFLGLSGPWRFYEKAVSAACRGVRFQLFRTVTFDTYGTFSVAKSGLWHMI